MTTEPFNLRRLIREVLAETDETNLDALINGVYMATGERNMHLAYAQALPSLIREVLGNAPRLYTSPLGQDTDGTHNDE